jgi:hypothetical protein
MSYDAHVRVRFAVCGLRFAVCGLRFAVCGLRFAVCGLRFTVCGLRFTVCGLRLTVCGLHGVAGQQMGFGLLLRCCECNYASGASALGLLNVS